MLQIFQHGEDTNDLAGINSNQKSNESKTIDLNESLERRRAIKELQSLWSEYEHEKRSELT